jgi:hypothetical protein
MNGLLWERRDDDEMIDRENRPGTPLTKYSVFPQQIKSSPHCSLAPFRRQKEAFNQLQGHRDHESAEAALRVKRVLGGVKLCLSKKKIFCFTY